ncbi:hypothetical protein Pan161_17090 [Gimesia algae]|uniref:Signal peptide-containing protein n=2 Tax=Gimesia algae TaxID=2527971 RepID=A0A517VAM7_9PLAN|nr:hypothetical protein Pan161_17090 [Gimesia algae]
MLQKVMVYIAMLFFAALIAGLYGMIHDQISYTVSPEYFTRFKFQQFGLPWGEQSQRLGAAVVGFMATWWMGVLVSLPLGLFSFRFPTPDMMARKLAIAFLIVILVALLTGLLGLGIAMIVINAETIDGSLRLVRPNVQDPIQFVRVGFMHNASYLGGLLGLIAGIIYLCRTSTQ